MIFHSVAHESEPRSLLGVALFPAHALREMPHLLVIACAWVGTLAPSRDARAAARQAGALIVLTAATVAILFAWASLEEGAGAAWIDLSQSRGAADLVERGIHFRMHAASDLALGCLFAAAGGLYAGAGLGALVPAGAALLAAMAAAWGLSGIAEPRLAAHAAREVFTHALVTLPIVMAWAARRRAFEPAIALRSRRWVWLAVAGAAITSGALAAAVARAGGPAGVLRHASNPGRSLPLNLAVHNFEHLLDALFLVAVTSVASGRGAGSGGSEERAQIGRAAPPATV